VRSVMLHALQNVQPSHLLDKDVASVWDERAESVRPRTSVTPSFPKGGPGRISPEISPAEAKSPLIPL